MSKTASFFAPAMIALFFATSAGAQVPDSAKPDVVVAEVVKLKAMVTAVDRVGRTVTLRSEDGDEIEIALSDQVKNFDQIKAGDTVTTTMYEATAIFVSEGRVPSGALNEEAVQVVSPGEKPTGVTAYMIEITAVVEDIDAARHIMKLKGSEGHIRVLKVGSEVKNLAAVKKGDMLVVRHTEEVAIDVTK